MNRKFFLAILLVIFLIPACASSGDSSTIQAQPTNTPTPTPTLTPTPIPPTPEVAHTPIPADVNAPLVIARSPRLGENLSLEGNIELVFDQEMDRASVAQAFTLQQAGETPVAVGGDFTWIDNTTVRFQPTQALERGAAYDVILTQDATAQTGEPLREPYTFRFETIGYLQVAQVIPAPDTGEVEPRPAITVIFDRPIIPLTSLEEMEKLPHPLTFEPGIEGSGEWLKTDTYVFNPSQPLAQGKTYTVIVSAGLEDPQGAILAEDYIWQFTTKPPAPVKVGQTIPADQQTQVGIETSIAARFNYALDPDTAIQSFSLTAGGLFKPEVKGEFEVEGDTLTFTPTKRLDFDTTYTVKLAAGVADQDGIARMPGDFTWQFTTVPLPKIISTAPENGDRNAPSYTDFRVTFSAPIDMDTVLPNLEITPSISPSQISTHFSRGHNTLSVYFGAKPSTDYVIVVKNGIADPYGNRIPRGRTVKFRTADLPASYQIRYSDPVATYDAAAPINLVVSHLNVHQLKMQLYRLSGEALPRLQREWSTITPGQNQLVREWAQSLESPLNKPSFSLINLAETPGGTLEPGLYLLVSDSPEVKEENRTPGRWRHVLLVSNLSLTMKTGPKETFVWATDMESGQPVANLPLTFQDENHGRLDTVTTAGDGVARLALRQDHGHIMAFSGAFSEDDPFAAISTNWERGISPQAFGLGDGLYAQDLRAYLYTDRPIYRPGQTVHFKGVIRAEDDANFRLADVGDVQVIIRDVTGQELFNESLPVSQLGTFNGSIDLKEDASLGHYAISIRLADQYVEHLFQVAAYRPPEFSVSVTPDAAEIQRGDNVEVTVETSYLFGGPLVNAEVRWNVLAQDYRFKPPWGGRYSFTDVNDPYTCFDCWWWESYSPPMPILSGSGQTDADGKLVIKLGGEQLGQNLPYRAARLTIEATAIGSDNQFISSQNSLIMHPGPYYLGLSPQQYVSEAGEESNIDLIAVNWNGDPLPQKSIKVQLYQHQWTNQFVAETHGGHWESQVEKNLVDEVILTTDDMGQATATFTPPAGGSYQIVATPTEPTTREEMIHSSLFIWVKGEDHVSWQRENHDRITLVSNKLTYKVGETAEILIPAPFEGEYYALMTVERGGILRHEVLKLASNSYLYRLPITEADVPNIYVSATLFKGRTPDSYAEFKMGILPFDVSLEPKTLALHIEADTEQAAPGQDVTYTVTATEPDGQPAAGAELSLDLVDKAVLNLQPRTTNILSHFFARRALEVRTANSLTLFANRFLEELIADLELELAQTEQALGADRGAAEEIVEAEKEVVGMAVPTPTAALAPLAEEAAPAEDSGIAPPPAVEVREEFADTAFWEPALITNRAGQAEVTITLPDNLTTWVMRGVGLTANTVVGEQTTELVSAKPLLIRPVTPRFFVVDDRAQLAANVNNNTDEDLDVEVSLSAEGVLIDSDTPPAQTVAIPAHGEAKVTWNVKVKDVTETQLIFSAVSGPSTSSGQVYSDASKPRLATGPDGSLLVLRYTAPDIVGTAGQLTEGGSRTETIALPAEYDERKGQLTVKLDPSLAAGMQDGLEYLVYYEYGCTEQTVSRFLPNVLVFNAWQSLGIENPELAKRLPGLVERGITKLQREQNPDGGWGWWYKPQEWRSNPHVSAYAVFGLLKAKQGGFEVSEGALSKGLDYLQTQVQGLDKYGHFRDANRQAWLLYVLAEGNAAPQDKLDELFDNREQLSYYARAYLAQALWLVDENDSRLNTLLSDLNNAAIVSATGAHWEEDKLDWWAMNTDTRSTAIVIDTLTKLDPDNALIPNAVRWLMVARKLGIWETTQETAWALIALTDWMLTTGELDADYDYALYLNDETLAEGKATRETVREGETVVVPIADLIADAANALAIARTDGNGRLYYTAHLEVFLPVEKIEPAERGITVSRRYTLADCSGSSNCTDVREAKLGDVIRVDLTITAPNDLYYVVVEDPLPAGGEAIDPSLATTSQLAPDPTLRRQDSHYWWGSWYSRGELRDEKVVLFADYLRKGTYEFSYTFRTTLPGDYHIIPTVAQEFYFPEVFGRSEGRLLSIGE